jgi:hypothetical protein
MFGINLRRQFACATKLGKHAVLVDRRVSCLGSGRTHPTVPAGMAEHANASPMRWTALASSTNGRVFQSSIQAGEEAARQAARSECEQTTSRTCNVTISVPSNWDAVALQCGSRVFMGGSGLGYAFDKAMEKARDAGYSTWECRQIANY